jgi:hypothetical protein
MDEKIEKTLEGILRDLDALRVEVLRLRRMLRENDDKTPTRPISQTALEAFRASASFLKKPTD